MKIKKLQTGGLLTYTPTAIPQLHGLTPYQPESSSSSGGSDELLSKDIVKQLLENGLSNDVDQYLKQLNKMSSVIAANPRMASQFMLGQYSSINKIIQNKSILEDAVKRSDSNNGLNEMAITTTGQIIVEDTTTGKIDQVSAKELQENLDILRPITNSELVQRRQTDPSLAFNTTISSIVGNGIGPDKITEYVLNIAGKVGKASLTQEGFVNTREKDIAEGMKSLLEGGVDGIYKITSSDTNQSKQMLKAIEYIYATLPQNMKNFLRATSAAQGVDPEAGVLELIESMVSSTHTYSSDTKLNFESTQTKALDEKSGSSGSSGTDHNITQSVIIVNGEGSTRGDFVLNMGTNHMMKFDDVQFFQTPHDKKNNTQIGQSMTLQDLLTETQLAGIVDPGSVYMGNQKITEDQFDNIVYNNNDGFISVYIPFKMEGGHKVPDFETLKNLSKAQDEVEMLPKGSTRQEKMIIFDRHGVGQYFQMVDSKNVDERLVSKFIVFSGITSTDNEYGIGRVKDDLLSIDRASVRPDQVGIFQQVINRPTTAGGKPSNKKINTWYERIGILSDKIISGSVFIPISQDRIGPLSAANVFRIPKSSTDHMTIKRNQEIIYNRQQLGETTSSALDTQ